MFEKTSQVRRYRGQFRLGYGVEEREREGEEGSMGGEEEHGRRGGTALPCRLGYVREGMSGSTSPG